MGYLMLKPSLKNICGIIYLKFEDINPKLNVMSQP